MPKVSFDVPQDLYDDVMGHVGDRRKFVTFSEAVRSALRKMLDQFDEVDARHGRIDERGGTPTVPRSTRVARPSGARRNSTAVRFSSSLRRKGGGL